ncbi:MAG: curli-like amyloid fiber formation chaperone CsgH [Methyloceanibacter sp.]|uniref:curli-like amyloid fiber formation chaperone CsgH n=1 Tax=Methyloceanibacter sp. TaxID=1965321 RepID=UPI003D6CD4F6
MSSIIAKSFAALLPLGLAFGASAGGDVPPSAADQPSCDIRVAHQGGSVVLEGLVYAPEPISGVYQLQVSQSGANRSNIRQGGEFEAVPGAPASLGTVTLSLGSGGYVATLNVQWDGGATDCTRHVGNGTQL